MLRVYQHMTRQFLQMMNKPDVDSIDGLSPAISIDKKLHKKIQEVP